MDEQGPLRPQEAWLGVAECLLATPALLVRGLIRLPEGRLGTRIRFADGTSAPVYRETRLGSGLARDPCTLVVAFRLRLVGGAGHTAFRKESVLNTPLRGPGPRDGARSPAGPDDGDRPGPQQGPQTRDVGDERPPVRCGQVGVGRGQVDRAADLGPVEVPSCTQSQIREDLEHRVAGGERVGREHGDARPACRRDEVLQQQRAQAPVVLVVRDRE
ncbi:hypothetical protein [Streptomyces lavendulocolor]|uniref:hypothetical protein n=1 Tax=Streptomyces lavendulocolor TaxID=67316 RepID=UPI003C2E0D05